MASIGRLKRGRTRDYTIPVRLNQHQLQQQLAPRDQIMLEARKFVKQLLPYLTLFSLIVILASTCHCDNSSTSLTTKEPINRLPARDAIDSTSKRNNKQRLLAMLSENIERQHLNRHSRPSKFDSSSDELVVETLHASPSQSQHSLTVQAGQPAAKKSNIKSLSAEEQALRDIMRMHEQPTQMYHMSPTPPTPNEPAKTSHGLLSYISAPKLLSGVAKMIKLDTNSSRPFTGRSASGQVTTTTTTPSPFVMHKYHFLALPNWLTRSRQQSGAKPSTMFGDANNSRDWMMSTAASPDDDLVADSSQQQQQQQQQQAAQAPRPGGSRQNRGNKALSLAATAEDSWSSSDTRAPTLAAKWLKNQLAQNYLHDSLRGLLTLSQLPILPGGPVSTAPSVLEPRPRPVSQQRRRVFANNMMNNATTTQSPNRRAKALEDLYRYAYILGTSMISRKRDPLKALSAKPTLGAGAPQSGRPITQRSIGQLAADNRRQMINLAKALQQALFGSRPGVGVGGAKQQAANPRGVMWDMATDPTLVVTLMHMIERASVALPLGFLLMPLVQMIRMNPLGGINHLSRMLPARALHRSVEHELLAKRLDAVDKVLSRALRPTHREG